MLVVYLTDVSPQVIISIGLSDTFDVIVERGTSHPIELQKEVKVMFRP